jgi:hypothetical protein
MTSDGISSEDWERVHELALDIVNAPDSDDRKAYDELIAYLDQLRIKYGERASLLATQADYVDDPREAERLLLKAFDIAIAQGDVPNVREISLSLADLYANDLKDVVAASRWLEISAAHIEDRDEMSRAEYQHIQEMIERLKHSS